jgi:hypothetical protein
MFAWLKENDTSIKNKEVLEEYEALVAGIISQEKEEE